jgi:hypothetical protein
MSESSVGSSREVNSQVSFMMTRKEDTIEELDEIMRNLDLGKASDHSDSSQNSAETQQRISPPETAMSPTRYTKYTSSYLNKQSGKTFLELTTYNTHNLLDGLLLEHKIKSSLEKLRATEEPFDDRDELYKLNVEEK